MSDYQEAKKKEVRKSPVSASHIQAEEENPVQNASPCPGCGEAIPEGAVFCPECGYNLKNPSFCTNCGTEIVEGADICVSCKSWILHDQCVFCYAHLDSNAAFCEECGNPRDGIVCPGCGSLSIFDFCTKCGKPLTEGAAKAIALAKSDPDAKAFVESIQETVNINSEIEELTALLNEIPIAPPSATPAKPQERKMGRFSDSKMAAILQTDQNMDGAVKRRADEQRKADEHAKTQADAAQQAETERLQRVHDKKVKEAQARLEALEKERQKALAAAAEARARLKSKIFPSNQDARSFHNAMRPVNPRGWLCNYADVLHEAGPNDCHCPSQGGEWIT